MATHTTIWDVPSGKDGKVWTAQSWDYSAGQGVKARNAEHLTYKDALAFIAQDKDFGANDQRIMAEGFDYSEVYPAYGKGGIRTGTFAETTLVHA